jgi:MerR family transcriptional regulator/heat shock protein HspR
MGDHSHQIILWRAVHSLLTVEDLSSAAGIHPDLVKKFASYGLIEPVSRSGAFGLFSASSVERLRRIVRLRSDLGVNLAGIAVILNMRERQEALQRELERFRDRLEGRMR